MPTVSVTTISWQGVKRILLRFSYSHQLVEAAKRIPGYRYSQTHKGFHYPEAIDTIAMARKVFSGLAELTQDSSIATHPVASLVAEKLPEEPHKLPVPFKHMEPQEVASNVVEDKIRQFRYWMQSRRYSNSTVSTYSDAIRSFLKFFRHKSLEEITNDDVILYNNEYIRKHNLSASYQNQVVNAIKLFFTTVEKRALVIEQVHRPKKPKLLPNVLSKEEVKLILNAHSNLKHRAMLSLIYSCGLRRSEILNLKPSDVDSNRSLLIVRQAKGKKDRIVPLSAKTIEMLRTYHGAFKPTTWLFEGQYKNCKYDERSLANVLKSAVEKAGIKKAVSLHWLRHSYATHLLEAGTNLRYIQEILGHASSKTTEIYTHVSRAGIQNVVSPFDSL